MQEEYLDWFFLHHYNKNRSYWQSLTDDKINTLMMFEHRHEEKQWETLGELLSKMFGGK